MNSHFSTCPSEPPRWRRGTTREVRIDDLKFKTSYEASVGRQMANTYSYQLAGYTRKVAEGAAGSSACLLGSSRLRIIQKITTCGSQDARDCRPHGNAASGKNTSDVLLFSYYCFMWTRTTVANKCVSQPLNQLETVIQSMGNCSAPLLFLFINTGRTAIYYKKMGSMCQS